MLTVLTPGYPSADTLKEKFYIFILRLRIFLACLVFCFFVDVFLGDAKLQRKGLTPVQRLLVWQKKKAANVLFLCSFPLVPYFKVHMTGFHIFLIMT